MDGLTGAIVDVETCATWVKEKLHGVAVEPAVSGNDLADKIHIHCSDIAKSFYIIDIFCNKLRKINSYIR